MSALYEFCELVLLITAISSCGHLVNRGSSPRNLSLNVVLGICAIAVGASVFFLFSISLIGAITIIVGAMFYSLTSRQFRKTLFSDELFFLLLLYVIFKLVIFRGQAFAFRLHVNEDAYGIGALFGFMRQHFSYDALLHDFYHYTGLSEPKWGATKIIPNMYSISDAEVRFASDQVIGSGRIGYTAMLAVLSKLFPANIYFTFVSLFSLIGAWSFAGIGYQLCQEMMNRVGLPKMPSSHVQIAKAAFFLILPCIPLIQILFIEGMFPALLVQNQILLSVIFFFRLSQDRSAWRDRAFTGDIAIIVLIILSVYFAYPDVLPVFVAMEVGAIAIVGGYGLLRAAIFARLASKPSPANLMSIMLFLILPIFLTAVDGRMREQFVARYSKIGSGIIEIGGAIHFGFPSFLDLVAGVPGKIIKFVRPGPSNAGNGFSIGTSNYFPSPDPAVLFLGLAFVLIGLVALWIIVRKRYGGVVIFTFTPVALVFLIPAFQLLQIKLGRPTNDYSYFRMVAVCIVFAAPILLQSAFYVASTAVEFRSRGFAPLASITVYAIFAALLVAYSQLVLFKVTETYLVASRIADSSRGCPNIDLSASVFVTDIPDARIFYILTCGPLNYLTDNGGPNLSGAYFIPNGKIYSIYRATFFETGVELEPIGRVKLDRKIEGPLTTEQVRDMFASGVLSVDGVKIP